MGAVVYLLKCSECAGTVEPGGASAYAALVSDSTVITAIASFGMSRLAVMCCATVFRALRERM